MPRVGIDGALVPRARLPEPRWRPCSSDSFDSKEKIKNISENAISPFLCETRRSAAQKGDLLCLLQEPS